MQWKQNEWKQGSKKASPETLPKQMGQELRDGAFLGARDEGDDDDDDEDDADGETLASMAGQDAMVATENRG
jgi:isochorismate synthase EntC